MKTDQATHYVITDYQKQKPFSSFLSGIAGPMGIPMWAFYVNRGQLIASFGVRDKNGQIMEFFPANGAYREVPTIGFRTFVKEDGVVHEFFKEQNASQTLRIRHDQIQIEEHAQALGLTLKVTYFTLPNANVAGLIRNVELINHRSKQRTIELVDGLAQMLPSGVDFGSYKAVSNLLQSWMQAEINDDYVFLTLRASTGDSVEVSAVKDGHFYIRSGLDDAFYVTDTKLIFDEDTTLQTPYGFKEASYDTLKTTPQTFVNQVPSAMSVARVVLDDAVTFYGLYGYANDRSRVKTLAAEVTNTYFKTKAQENEDLHNTLVRPAQTHTGLPSYDAYVKQCYLDNALRGGIPWTVNVKDKTIGYYLYSRKHGDLERDYNFFHLEPGYYSQGNGNFRDVLQNRRNDIFFNPDIGEFNIRQFASLVQADGYNPLSIEGVTFDFEGDCERYPDKVRTLLEASFTPGALAMALETSGCHVDDDLKTILEASRVNIKARYGEGYWEDHFTYLYDLFDAYLAVYPDKEEALFFDMMVPYFKSPAKVLKRVQKHVIDQAGNIRQFGAVKHLEHDGKDWLEHNGKIVFANLFGKLLTLVLNKAAHLDPLGIGLSYEAGKPGWNDAMNGLPGLFGSGVAEMFELKTLNQCLLDVIRRYPTREVTLLMATETLANELVDIQNDDPFQDWDARMTALETYRDKIITDHQLTTSAAQAYEHVLDLIQKRLNRAEAKAKALAPIMPTFLTYRATCHTPLEEANGSPVMSHYGRPAVKVQAFEMVPLPPFLEAPARYLKHSEDPKDAYELYQTIRESGLYDKTLKFYQTSVSLDGESHEIGRIRAFTPGWLERESNFLHMTYKYVLALFKAGLYEVFFDEIKDNYTCFMDPIRYGRPPFENSSFLAPTSNPDPKKHGQGFVSRLTGSTAEVLTMWRLMFFGNRLFEMADNQLTFRLKPMLDASFFDENHLASATLFNQVTVVYHNPERHNLYEKGVGICSMTLLKDGVSHVIEGDLVRGQLAHDIRNKLIEQIDVIIAVRP